jgi:hypothetical protein
VYGNTRPLLVSAIEQTGRTGAAKLGGVETHHGEKV